MADTPSFHPNMPPNLKQMFVDNGDGTFSPKVSASVAVAATNMQTAAKGATAQGNPTSSAVDANTQALDVYVRGGSAGGPSIVDNAAFTDGTTSIAPAGYIFDEAAGTALTENDAAAARVDSKRAQVHVIEDATTRGQRAAVSAAGRVSVDASGVAVPVTDNAGSLTVDAPVGTPVFVRLSDGAAAITALPITDNAGSLTVDQPTGTNLHTVLDSGTLSTITNVVHVDDNAGSITVDGTVTANVASAGGKTPAFASISVASSGSNTIVAADATKKIKVVSYVLVADAAVTAKWQSAANDKSGAMSLAANGGVSAIGSFDAHILETAANEALNLNLGGAIGVRGHISYFLE